MTRKLPLLLLLCVCGGTLRAAEAAADAGEARLREALRNATLQLRTAETERANLQTAQAALLEEKKALADKFEALRKQTVADRAADDKAIAALKAKSATEEAEVARLMQALEKSEAAGKEAAAVGVAKETERAKLAAEILVLKRKIDDREMKNLALFKLGNEILTRYQKFTLGEALAAREPFVGSTRAKLETLVQDYQDKLLDQRAKP
jgi:DNA repair exonuclease SbcCD ATPase subunit